MAIGERPSGDGGPLTAMVRGRRLWFVAFLGFFLIGCAWAVAMPYSGVPDEGNHILRAAGVGRGEIVGEKAPASAGAGAFHHVKRGLLRDNMCWQGRPGTSASCSMQPNGDRTLVRVHTTAGRYPPAYYAAVGVPLAIWPTWTGVYLARMIGAAIVSAFLASSVFAAARWSRRPLMLAAVIVAITPVTLYLSGGVNPSGVEIAAGLAFFSGLSALVLERRPIAMRAALTLTGIAGATLIAVRPFGPLWILATLGVCFVPTTRERIRRVLGHRRGQVWLAVLSAVFVASVAWTLLVHTGEPGWVSAPNGATPEQAVRFELFQRLGGYATEMVGIMSWLDAPMPGQAYTVWFMAFGMLFLAGFALGDWRDRWRMVVLTLIALCVLVIPDTLNARTYGFQSQGRYLLPITVGLPILAAHALGKRGALLGSQARSIIRVFVLLLLPIHFFALYYTMIRWQYGLNFIPNVKANVFHGYWLPKLGPELPIAMGAAGVLLLMATVWVASIQVPPVDAQPGVEPGTGLGGPVEQVREDDAGSSKLPDIVPLTSPA